MNTNNIKRYAPKARTAFIAAMTKRAALFGIRESSILSMGIELLEQKGDLALIGDRPFPASIIRPRAALVKKVEQIGFAQAMEQAAYSWFNRLCAIRYMELKGYLDHGRRVLSHPDQPGSFQILDDCLDIDLEGLDKQHIAELKLDGTKDEELYRELLLAQCHALHKAMPFLFEAVDDATELLLPDNLTKTDSLIRELVSAIPVEDWLDVEIIGWLYQFYISEKKDQVIGKVVKSEDIPAATQLFTPNWIVQYLVQNSVGRQWLLTYPDSPLKTKWDYYIEPAEQTPEVQVQLAAITPHSIDPLSIKVLDPACGSGHILVEAYKVLKAIYEERGFRSRDIPQMILENNLFGLDIDDRAGQLAGFALMMLARADDRRIFTREVKLNVLSLQESSHLDFAGLWKALNFNSDWQRGQSQSLFESEQTDLSAASVDNRYQLLKNTLARFTQAKTFGSLIDVPAEDAELLGEVLEQLRKLEREGDVMQMPAAVQLIPFLQQALVLAQRYDAVVANPPYMDRKNMIPSIKSFAKDMFPDSSADLYSMFIEKSRRLNNDRGHTAMITMDSWTYGDDYTDLRSKIISNTNIANMIHLGPHAFPEIKGEVVQTAAFVMPNRMIHNAIGIFHRLVKHKSSELKKEALLKKADMYSATVERFADLPRKIFAYYANDHEISAFKKGKPLKEIAEAVTGLQTGNNERFIREWYEVSIDKIVFNSLSRDEALSSKSKWIPYVKGSDFRKWYGNNRNVINWENDGAEIKKLDSARPQNQNYYFRTGLAYNNISKNFSARFVEDGYIFDQKNSMLFSKNNEHSKHALGFLLSGLAKPFLDILSPKDFNPGSMNLIPMLGLNEHNKRHEEVINELIDISKNDWDDLEISWSFKKDKIVAATNQKTLRKGYSTFLEKCESTAKRSQDLERENHEYFSHLYEINSSFDAQIEQITLFKNPAYRYRADDEITAKLRFQTDTYLELISYGIGCMMGRYSLDREGLVYGHARNQGFAELVAEGAFKTFPADSDGILPLTDQEWFADDATNRFSEFVRTIWGDEHLQENLAFVAESLCLHAIKPKRGESALDTIRRYLSTQFFKDHLKIYKRRPIYWLFSSGKHKAFECLIYLHRYNEGTLARMRTEYVIPLTAKLNTYANKLATDIENETVTPEKKRLEKELATLHNQQAELATFDEKLRHHADQRISLDLDDGVKVNYGKFGDLLTEVKAITGEKAE